MVRKKLIYRRVAVIMSFVMFLSSVGFSVNVGHCNMQNSDADGKKSCMQLSEDGSKGCPPGCCDFEQLTFEGIDFDSVTQSSEITDKTPSISLYAFEADLSMTIEVFSPKDFLLYTPPLPDRQLPILYQSFLL